MLTVEQILTTVYAKEFGNGLFGLAYAGEEVVIDFWKVPNIAQPTKQEIFALDTPELEHIYACNVFLAEFLPKVGAFIDSVARQRTYENALSCTSYVNSTNLQWASEAYEFISWRDISWQYLLTQQEAIMEGSRPIPVNPDVLLKELPIISWPTV